MQNHGWALKGLLIQGQLCTVPCSVFKLTSDWNCESLQPDWYQGERENQSFLRVHTEVIAPRCPGKWDNLIGQNSINHPLKGLPCASFLFYPSWPLKFLSEQMCLEWEAHTINPAQSTNSRAPGPPPAPPELLFSHKHGRWTMNRVPLHKPQLRAGWGERREIFAFLSFQSTLSKGGLSDNV